MQHAPSTLGRKYTWHPGLPNRFALHYESAGKQEAELPQSVDLRSAFPPVYDQKSLGSCVDNAVAALIESSCMAAKYKWPFTPSRLFLYYNARSIEGTVDSDSGSSVADGINSANEFGVCPEVIHDGSTPDWLWTYDDGQTKFKEKPPAQCYKDAILHKAIKSEIINLDRNTVLNALAAGKAFAFGFTVHQSFESSQMAADGIMHAPGGLDWLTDPVLGGHCTVVVGYMLNHPMGHQGVTDWAIVRNSWSANWGDKGHFYMPLDQVLCNAQQASDAHAIDLVGV